MKIEYEEYRSNELIDIKENKIFEAEDFKNVEISSINSESYQSPEVEERQNIGNNQNKDNSPKSKVDLLKKKIKILTSMITTTSVAVIAVSIEGIIPIIPIADANYGKVEVVNYYVDYNYNSSNIENNVIIYFDNELEEGFKYIVNNKNNNEIKSPTFDCVTFNDIGNSSVTFELEIVDKENKKVESYDFIVNPKSNPSIDLSNGQFNYKVIENEDESKDLNLYLEESNNFHLKAFVYDKENNLLNYESSYSENVITIPNIKEDVFNVVAGAYRLDEGNYYREKIYILDNFNINIPSFIEIDRVEILNESFISNDFIPTYLYLDGYLSGLDYAEVVVYSSAGEILDKISNITELDMPLIFNGLPQDEPITFKYFIYNYDEILEEKQYEVLLQVPDEYLSLDYSYSFANPGDGLITYNDDYTFNYYLLSNFENKSEYEVVYKVELTDDMIPMYEYIGTDYFAGIYDIGPNQYYPLTHKIFVKDGKNYYAINNYYALSGTVGIAYTEDNQLESTGIEFYKIEEKVYGLSSYAPMYGNMEVEVILSTNEIIKYTFTEEELEFTINIDLTRYEYDSLIINIRAMINPNFGDGKKILESQTDIKGNIYAEINFEYVEGKGE